MSMTKEQQEELLIGLRTEVLELKEMLSDEYYSINQLSDKKYMKDSDVNDILKKYITSEEISDKYKTIKSANKVDNELKESISKCITKSELESYIVKDDFNKSINLINNKINELKNSLIELDLSKYYTKSEIDDIGFLTEHQSIDNFVTYDWIESMGYIREHQSLSSYATKKWVESKLENIEIDLSDYVKMVDLPTKLSKFDNDCGFLTEHQSLSEYVKKDDIKILSSDVSYIKNKFDNVYDSGFITMKDVESYLDMLNLSDIYAKKTDIPSLKGYITSSDLKTIRTSISDINEKTSNLLSIKDVKEYISLLNLDEKYAKKTDIPSLKGYVKSSDLDNISSKIYDINKRTSKLLSINDVKKYVTSLNIDSIYAKKTDIPSLSGYAKIKYVSENYAKKTDIPDISVLYSNNEIDELFVSKEYLPSVLSGYVKKLDLSSYGKIDYISKNYAKISDIPNISNIYTIDEVDNKFETIDGIDDKLERYVLKSYLYSNYVDKTYLSLYLKKKDFEDSISSFVDEYRVNNIINDTVKSYVKKTDIINDTYKDNSDEFESSIEKLDNGLYVVGEYVIILINGTTIKLKQA